MTQLVSKTGIEIKIPDIRRVDNGAPRRWLSKGWKDIKANTGFSIGLGIVFVLTGYLATYVAWQAPWALMTAITGFVLMAPVLAIGFYAISCAHEQNKIPTFGQAVKCWRGNGRSIMLYAVLLFLVLFVWSRFNWLITALMMHASGSVFTPTPEHLLGSLQGWGFVASYTFVGLLLALAVFAGSVVTLQLMMDRRADPITAVVTSVQVVLRNKRVMARWAGLIFLLTGIGIFSAYLGLIVLFPLLGHASWHAYRELLE